MLYADAVRGWDATGVFGVNRLGNVDIKKQASPAGHFVSTPEYKKFSEDMFQTYQMVIGHNRKATHGEKKHADAHPFWDKEEKICLVHNGMISNYKAFCVESTVDSAAIANALATENTDEVISRVEGAFTFIWYNVDEKKLYMIRNAARPLYMLETITTLMLASEDSLAYWVAKRNNSIINKCTELKVMTLYSFDLETRDFIEEREIKKKSTIITQTTSGVVHYLPSQRTTMGPMNTGVHNIFNHAPDSYFISDSNIKRIEDVPTHIKVQDRIMVQVDSYEELPRSDLYKISMVLLNVPAPFIEIYMYVKADAFRAADYSEALSVQVNNMVLKEDKYVFYVSNEEEHKVKETLNEVTVADVMWYDPRFPSDCTICGNRVRWADLPGSEILIDKKEDVLLLCSHCTGIKTNV